MVEPDFILNEINSKPGIDGCRAGWCVVFEANEQLQCSVIESLSTLQLHNIERCLIDMPIGLAPERHIDQDLRERLKPHRHHSVFSVPVRDAVYAKDYATAKINNIKASSKSVSIQAWNICPKIKALDILLIEQPNYKDRFMEAHPELCFMILNKQTHLQHKKSTKEGQLERLDILKRYDNRSEDVFKSALGDYKRSELKADDILDALVLFVSNQQELKFIPNNPLRDQHEIRMQIAYPDLKINY